MRIGKRLLLVTLLLPAGLLAQGPPPPPGGMPGPGGGPMSVSVAQMGGGGMGPRIVIRNNDMGEWWKNSDLVQKLKLSDQQIKQLSSVFYRHRLKLIDYQAAVEKQNLELQNLLDQDNPDESKVSTQVDQTLAARAKMEREFTMMNLDLRKVLTVDQWKRLKAIQRERVRADGNVFFYRQRGSGGPGPETAPPLPPPGR